MLNLLFQLTSFCFINDGLLKAFNLDKITLNLQTSLLNKNIVNLLKSCRKTKRFVMYSSPQFVSILEVDTVHTNMNLKES